MTRPRRNCSPRPQRTGLHAMWPGCLEKIRPSRTNTRIPAADTNLLGSSAVSTKMKMARANRKVALIMAFV